MSNSLRPHGLYGHGILQARILEQVALFLLQAIFPTQRSNPGLLHCRSILYQLSHKGNPRILEWVAYPFSGGSSWPRNRTRVSCTAGRFFTSWAIREAHETYISWSKKKTFKDKFNVELKCHWCHIPDWRKKYVWKIGDFVCGVLPLPCKSYWYYPSFTPPSDIISNSSPKEMFYYH